MQDRFHMGREINISYAKRNLVDSIYKSANLEGISVTYPETQQIYDGGNVAGLSVEEIVKINNLKHAWNFVLETIDYPSNYAFFCEINRLVNAGTSVPDVMLGVPRSVPVSIGGTDWKPNLPIESKVREELNALSKIECATERALETMTWALRRQIFYDGNKRTGMLFANKIMIENGCGVIQVPVSQQNAFFDRLLTFYESGDNSELKGWLYEHCIDGFDLDVQLKNVILDTYDTKVFEKRNFDESAIDMDDELEF